MIPTHPLTSFRSLRRDRGAFLMSFVLPIGFFTIFGFVFGSMRTSDTPRVTVLARRSGSLLRPRARSSPVCSASRP